MPDSRSSDSSAERKIREAQDILTALGLPREQTNRRAALALLALAQIKPRSKWSSARRQSLGVVRGVMAFIREVYGQEYKENTRETIRRRTLHQFVQSGLAAYNPDDPSLPTNSPRAHYALTEAALKVVRSYGSNAWKREVAGFRKRQGSLLELYAKERTRHLVPLKLPDGTELSFSPGKHNELQVAVLHEFGPRFAQGARLLYVGDTANKTLYVDTARLQALGVPTDEHGKLPDVLLYDEKRNWLFLIEVVTSHGPVEPKRQLELERLLKDCDAGLVFVSAFPDFASFKRWAGAIAWETEVWVAEAPSHLIHYNGDRFYGPRT